MIPIEIDFTEKKQKTITFYINFYEKLAGSPTAYAYTNKDIADKMASADTPRIGNTAIPIKLTF